MAGKGGLGQAEFAGAGHRLGDQLEHFQLTLAYRLDHGCFALSELGIRKSGWAWESCQELIDIANQVVLVEVRRFADRRTEM